MKQWTQEILMYYEIKVSFDKAGTTGEFVRGWASVATVDGWNQYGAGAPID